jgi:hypothetical protein
VTKLERLIHLELADVVANGMYLEDGWPGKKPEPAAAVTSPKKGGNGNGGAAKVVKACDDCKLLP